MNVSKFTDIPVETGVFVVCSYISSHNQIVCASQLCQTDPKHRRRHKITCGYEMYFWFKITHIYRHVSWWDKSLNPCVLHSCVSVLFGVQKSSEIYLSCFHSTEIFSMEGPNHTHAWHRRQSHVNLVKMPLDTHISLIPDFEKSNCSCRISNQMIFSFPKYIKHIRFKK